MRRPLVLVLLAAGCGSYRVTRPLDGAEQAELAVLRARLAERRVWFAPCEPTPWLPAALADTMREAGLGAPVEAPIPGCVTVVVEDSSSSGRGEHLFTYLTFGVLPFYEPQSLSLRLRVVGSFGRDVCVRLEQRAPFVGGWLGLPFSLLPGWQTFWSIGFWPPSSAFDERLALELARRVAATLDARPR